MLYFCMYKEMYNSRKEFMTSYHLESACCGTTFEDKEWELECPHKDGAALIYANYAKRQFEVRNDLPGIYRYANWMPICRTLEGSGAPVTYKSEGLAEYLGLSNLYITFNGYWPERNAMMKTGSFKECEAFSVCARTNAFNDKIMVVASAGKLNGTANYWEDMTLADDKFPSYDFSVDLFRIEDDAFVLRKGSYDLAELLPDSMSNLSYVYARSETVKFTVASDVSEITYSYDMYFLGRTTTVTVVITEIGTTQLGYDLETDYVPYSPFALSLIHI